MVAAAAPAIFADSVGGVITKNATGAVVRPDNPAAQGDILVIWATGLGVTTPPLTTGQIVPLTPLSSVPNVSVTIGGMPAEVIHALATPQTVGLYQIAVTTPGGLTAGNQQVVVTAGGVQSNAVNLAVR
jgi:uncharacterized protein (TIGR03437 family)